MVLGCVGEEPAFPECEAGAPFDAPAPLSELAEVGSTEANLTLDPATENRAYFSSARGGRALALFSAQRANRASLFSPPATVTAVSAPSGTTRVQITRDELTMVLTADAIYVARRAKPGDGFDGPIKLALAHDGKAASAPRCASIDREGTTLYYSDGTDIYQQPLAQPETPSTRIAELSGFSCLVVSADGNEGFVRGADGKVYRTARAGTWSAPVLEVKLSGERGQSQVTYLSRNRCDAYLTSNESGVEHAYWAHRTPR